MTNLDARRNIRTLELGFCALQGSTRQIRESK
jgi:hypothetical protein